ncbi:tubulin delta chain-like [Apostichopus japonicus]|uniref:tubulin delta chain-like n=1 Tax=Stichopus japonicus TaxID=307972 RepID=UPI003AB2DAAB
MSCVPIFVGQCGNQVGSALFELLDGSKEPIRLWESANGKRNAILVDSEPKVVRSLAVNKKRLHFQESNIISTKQGCGSNWALGYFGTNHQQRNSLLEESLEVIRRQTEKCDAFSGFIMMHSLAGGTGSGVGSHLTEVLRDEYALAYTLSCVMAPFSTGDSPLQHYNMLLSTAWLQRYTDGIIFLKNDDILQSFINKVQTAKTSQNSPSMKDMNKKIAESLASIFLPIESLNPVKGVLTGQEPWELLRSVTPMPDYKFISINQTIKSKSGWESIMKGLLQPMRKHSSSGERFHSISNLVIARGDSSRTFPSCIAGIEKAIRSSCRCVSWNPYPVDYWQGTKHFHLKANEGSICLCSNSSSVVEDLQNSLTKGKAMLKAGGYLHWYRRYGCTEDIFEDAFETIHSVIDNYRSAVT